MNIFTNPTLTKIANNKTVRKVTSQMCNHKALLPIMLLESTVISGRTYQAYKRGGVTEARERIIDETLTAAVWFGIISWLNAGFSKLIKHKGVFNKEGLPEIAIDLGSDKIRNPIRQAIKKRPEIKNIIGGLKTTKVALAALAGIYLSGIALPKFYQGLTAKLLKKEKKEKFEQKTKSISMDDFINKTSQRNNNPSFKGANHFINTTAHILENNPIAKLLTIDAGLFLGRAYSARNNDERTEILFRDVCSSFFYMLSTPIIYNLLSQHVDKFKGKNTALDPNTVHLVTSYINNKIKHKKYSPEQFAKAALGTNDKLTSQVLSLINSETISLKSFRDTINSIVTDKKQAKSIINNAQQFINLRPQGASRRLLTISEVINSTQGGFINDAKFLTNAVKVATNGVSQDSKKFISFKEIDQIKQNIKQYAESLVEYAKRTGNKKITSNLLTQAKTRNLFVKVGYTLVGMAISSAFLSTIIPKIQYKITEMRTGKQEFPGIRDIK